MYGGPLVFAYVPLTLFLLKMRGRYAEIIVGLHFILILSDNLEPPFAFAKNLKNIYILVIFLFFILDRKKLAPYSRFFKRFIPFFIIAFIALVYSETIFVSLQKTISYAIMFLTIPNYVLYLYRKDGSYFFRQLLYMGFAVVFIGYLMKYVNFEFAISHGGRMRGLFGNPNGLGIFLIVTFILFYTVTDRYKDLFSKQEKLLFYFIYFIALVASGSRTSLVAVIMFFFFLRFYKMSPFLGFIIMLASIILVEVITSNLVVIVTSLGLEDYFRLRTLQEGSGRLIAWRFAWENIQDYFFIGRGFAYDEFLMRSNFDRLSRMGHEGGVHNTYLIIWLNTGLIGLMLYFRGFLLSFIKAAKKTRLAMPAMFAILFSINFEPWLAASLNPYTIVFLIIVTIMSEDEFYESHETLPELEKAD